MILIISLVFFGSISININIYVKKHLSAEYNKGLEQGKIEGKTEIGNFITTQIQQTGQLKIKVGTNEQGQDLFLILAPVPQILKVETTTIDNK